jgi:hypothetical protein
MDNLPPELAELIDERVFQFAQGAQIHYKTNDLVVMLDLMEENPQLEAIPRQSLATSEDVPAAFRLKISKPASAISEVLGSPSQAFWFLVIYEAGDADCAAINASLLAPGGTA